MAEYCFSLSNPGARVYLFASLLDLATFGGTRKMARFILFRRWICRYMYTSDGASVNFGKKTGLMKRMAEETVWLVKIHCANHRVELAVKEVIIDSKFKTVDNTYIITFGLFKNLGKIKSIIQEPCKSENIQHFTLSKIAGASQYLLMFVLLVFTKLKFILKFESSTIKKRPNKNINLRNKIFFKMSK